MTEGFCLSLCGNAVRVGPGFGTKSIYKQVSLYAKEGLVVS